MFYVQMIYIYIYTSVYTRRKWETCITQFSLSPHSRQLSFSLSFLQAICPSSGQTRNVSCGCWSRNEFELLTGRAAVSRTNWLFADSQCVVTHSEDKIWHVQVWCNLARPRAALPYNPLQPVQSHDSEERRVTAYAQSDSWLGETRKYSHITEAFPVWSTRFKRKLAEDQYRKHCYEIRNLPSQNFLCFQVSAFSSFKVSRMAVRAMTSGAAWPWADGCGPVWAAERRQRSQLVSTLQPVRSSLHHHVSTHTRPRRHDQVPRQASQGEAGAGGELLSAATARHRPVQCSLCRHSSGQETQETETPRHGPDSWLHHPSLRPGRPHGASHTRHGEGLCPARAELKQEEEDRGIQTELCGGNQRKHQAKDDHRRHRRHSSGSVQRPHGSSKENNKLQLNLPPPSTSSFLFRTPFDPTDLVDVITKTKIDPSYLLSNDHCQIVRCWE